MVNYLDKPLFEEVIVSQAAKGTIDAFGVEIELEGRGLIPKDQQEAMVVYKWFTNHDDNSLRNIREDSENTEYVFKGPLNYLDTMKAISALMSYLNSEKAEVFESYRTSIHVHVNCAAETMRTVYNYITLAIIFDELFVSRNGDHRIGNNFCLRARDAQAQVDEIIQTIKHKQFVHGVNGNNRYSSVNVASLTKFGTIEFRSLECTTDFVRIKHWIDTIQRLKVYARDFENPREIIGRFSLKSVDEFIDEALGKQSIYYKNTPGWQGKLFEGMRLAQDLAFCSDWKLEQAQQQPALKKKLGHNHGWADAIIAQNQAAALFVNPAPFPQPNPMPIWHAEDLDDDDDMVDDHHDMDDDDDDDHDLDNDDF